MIRRANYVDIPQIVALGTRMLERAESPFVTFDPVAAKQGLFDCITAHVPGGAGAAFVAEEGGQIVGVFLGVVRRMHECTDTLIATNILWGVEPGHGGRAAWGLLRAFEDWAKDREERIVLRVSMDDTLIDPRKYETAMRRKGLRPRGMTFEKEL